MQERQYEETGREEICFKGSGGGWARRPISQLPPSLPAGPGDGGSARGVPYLSCRGAGGSTSTYMTPPHRADHYFDYTYVGGKLLVEKAFSVQNLCSSAPTSIVTQNKGPGTKAHVSNPLPSTLRRASGPTPPPPPWGNFQVAQCRVTAQSETIECHYGL